MTAKSKLGLFVLIGAAVALLLSQVVAACGPDIPAMIFINTQHPDLPIVPYAEGNLGVLQPTYSSIYLYVAYHDLTGVPFSAAQQVALWDGNTALTRGERVYRRNLIQKQQAFEAKRHQDWRQEWESAIGGDPGRAPARVQSAVGYMPGAGIYKRAAVHESWGVAYSQFLNCPQDAFHFALTTLRRLKGQFGGSSPIVKNWVQAQQTVFGDCSGGNEIPEALPSSAAAVAREARTYQIAAAHFYSGDYNQAAADFRAIARNPSSPWSTVAPYLVARSLVREATVDDPPGRKLATMAKAEAQLNSVLANPRYAKYHHAAEHLRGFIEFRLHPRQRLVELANRLTRLSLDPNLRQDLIDFTLLFPHVREEGAYAESQPVYPGIYKKLADLRAKSDLIDWLLTFKLNAPEAFDHSYARWKSTNSPAWLIAALTKARPDDPRVPELLAAAGRTQLPEALDSVTFERLRLMLLRGESGAVRRQLTLFLAHDRMRNFGGTPRSTLNLFAAMRFELARNLEDLFAAAPRVPAMFADTSERGEMPAVDLWGYKPGEPRLDGDAVTVFNRYLPIALLAKAVQSTKLPENLRREIALAAWTRAALLGNAAVARSLAPSVETFVPELTASLRAYDSARTPAARRFAAVFTALRFPGLRPFVVTHERAAWNGTTPLDKINGYRDNWWGSQGVVCGPPRGPIPPGTIVNHWPTLGPELQAIYPGGKIVPPAFLTKRQDAEAAREWQSLMAMGPAPDFLSAHAISWAKAHPSDSRVPEALALAVRSTRSGMCADPLTGQLSKSAFDLLHERYPNSNWAKKTKYWFKM